MFTGIVQRTGSLGSVTRERGGAVLRVDAGEWPEPLEFGESVAVQGVCFTVAAVGDGCFFADVLESTLEATALGGLRRGARLNLERALRMADRLGGHIVTGHIDGVAKLTRLSRRGRDYAMRLSCRPEDYRYVVNKGSVALDGVSLTVSAMLESENEFEVNLIPTTWNETSLCERREGDAINLETDLLGKYVERLMSARGAPDERISLESLAAAGFGAER